MCCLITSVRCVAIIDGGSTTGIPTFEPSFHLPAIWITESQRERAESLGYTVVDPPSIIATHPVW